MDFIPTSLEGVYLIKPSQLSDSRGWFSRIYCRDEYATIEPGINWVQFNNSFTYKRGTIRGMHFQYEPYSEVKLVRCIAGRIFDVVIDIRKDSSTYLKWFSAELSAENRMMMYIPGGLAHGFQTLEDNCEVFYAHSSFFNSGYEGAIRYNDPAVGISWPLTVTEISERDKNHPLLKR